MNEKIYQLVEETAERDNNHPMDDISCSDENRFRTIGYDVSYSLSNEKTTKSKMVDPAGNNQKIKSKVKTKRIPIYRLGDTINKILSRADENLLALDVLSYHQYFYFESDMEIFKEYHKTAKSEGFQSLTTKLISGINTDADIAKLPKLPDAKHIQDSKNDIAILCRSILMEEPEQTDIVKEKEHDSNDDNQPESLMNAKIFTPMKPASVTMEYFLYELDDNGLEGLSKKLSELTDIVFNISAIREYYGKKTVDDFPNDIDDITKANNDNKEKDSFLAFRSSFGTSIANSQNMLHFMAMMSLFLGAVLCFINNLSPAVVILVCYLLFDSSSVWQASYSTMEIFLESLRTNQTLKQWNMYYRRKRFYSIVAWICCCVLIVMLNLAMEHNYAANAVHVW